MAETTKKFFLSEESEENTITVEQHIDEDEQSSASITFDHSQSEGYTYTFSLHKNALKGLIQELVKYL